MPLPPPLQGDARSLQMARHALPLLVWCAQHECTVTYGILAKHIQEKHEVGGSTRGYNQPLVWIGQALAITEGEWNRRVPMINTLVVSKKSGFPASGYTRFWNTYAVHPVYPRHPMTEQNRDGIIAHEQRLCFQFDRWDELLQEYGLRIPADFTGF